jgi:hypothetical protein
MATSQLWYLKILLSGPKHEFFFFYLPRVCEMLRNSSKHHFGSNGLEWMLHNFGTPKYCFRARNRSFLLLPTEGLRNAPKHFQTSFWVQWTRMDGSHLWYPEILHLGPKHEFFIFYPPKVCEMLRTTSIHHFGSNGLEWMLHNFGTPKYCFRARNTSFASFTCRRLAKCSETLPNIILGPMD